MKNAFEKTMDIINEAIDGAEKRVDVFDRKQDQINEMNDILKEIRGLSGDEKV